MSNLRTSLMRIFLAVGLSFALWAFVSLSENPEATVTFSDVPLQAVGLEPGLVIVDPNGLPTQALPPVDITLSTDQQQSTRLRPVDVRAVVDLGGLGFGDHIIPVNVQATRANLSFNVPEDGVEPSAVPIRLEQLSEHQVPLDLEVRGNLPFSFERGDPSVTFGGQQIESVRIDGPESRVERVVSARASANIEQLRATYLGPVTLVPVDAAGVPVEGVTVSPATVTVEIPINPVVGLKLVPVQPVVVGLPAAGYEVTGVRIEPPLIALTGSSGPLDAVDALTTAAVEIGGARETVVRSAEIIFPENTAPRPGESEQARITVEIAPLAMPFQVELPVAVALTGLGPGLQFSVNPQIVTVALSGSSGAIAALSQSPPRATVDVSGLDPGGYRLPVNLALPQGVTLVGDPPAVQVTLRAPATPTEAPEATVTAAPAGPSPTPGPAGPSPTAGPAEPTPTPEPPEPTPTGGPAPTP
jgi:YbbR domain-containing protein